jgi:hypothetical protein
MNMCMDIVLRGQALSDATTTAEPTLLPKMRGKSMPRWRVFEMRGSELEGFEGGGLGGDEEFAAEGGFCGAAV